MKRKAKAALNLDFLLIKRHKVGGWSLKKARSVCRMYQRHYSAVRMAKAVKMSTFGINTLLGELKRAAKAKMTLEAYFEKGRPLRYGKKVLA